MLWGQSNLGTNLSPATAESFNFGRDSDSPCLHPFPHPSSPTQGSVGGSQHRPPAVIAGPSTCRPQGRLTRVVSVLFTFFTAF